ncbi:Hypothetical leucine rich repeat protein [Ectocarpus siliculosus]|uniref:Hypothetical leucine rich repeat protein n=1 Tax=Ectocarpus siliculosus TaxID=2880 RepID=D7FIB5_ECTSI|nr:Hypothetical leucine rich repeat protein [Ectocarpus siliculosus]|eukprot:CBJ28739.1 Hypothetical leucine rich repeat protein [Ectocarpus siliculosus]
MGGGDLEQVNRSKVLHLTGMGLSRIPRPVLRSVGLTRLDLACNELPSVPAAISSLTNLEHLWLQGNPIASVHPDIQHCTRLKVLDLRNTALTKLPREIGRLSTILEIDLRGAPLKAKMKFFQRNTKGLMAYLRERDARKHIKVELYNKLSTGLYREVLDSPTGRHIHPLIKAVCLAFNDLQELTQVARHCDRLFPEDLATGGIDPTAAASTLREKFTVLGRKNERKRLASQLELKMRAIYYDVIDPAAVEGYIASIYQQVELLEDVQFLVRHAGTVMPPDPKEITGIGVKSSMLALQKDMTEARQRCVDGLFETLTQIYNDQESSKVRRLTQRVADVFAKGSRFADAKELEELKQLKADAQRVFPAEIREAEPIRIRTMFLAQRTEQKGD